MQSMSSGGRPIYLKEMFFEMQLQGYQPVIAHPERYIFVENNKRFFADLKDAGNFFQLNLLSLGGFNGRSVTELALYLLKNDFYDLVGSDVHNDRQLEALSHPSISSHLDKLLNSGKILNPQL